MKWIEKAANLLVNFCSILAVGCIAGILLISVCDVILRGLFNSPIIGATEISQMLMVGAVLGAGGGILTDQNIQVDIVVNALPKRVQQILELFTVTLSIIIYALIAWRLFVESGAAIRFSRAFSLLGVPYYPFYWLLALGFLGACVGGGLYLARVIRSMSGNAKNHEEKGDELAP